MTSSSDKAEAERRYPNQHSDLTYPLDALRGAARSAYIAGREDERAASAVPVSRDAHGDEIIVLKQWLADFRRAIDDDGFDYHLRPFAAEIDRILEGAR